MKLPRLLAPIALSALLCHCGNQPDDPGEGAGGGGGSDPVATLQKALIPEPSAEHDLFPGTAEKVAGKGWGEILSGAAESQPEYASEPLPDSPGHTGVRASMRIAGEEGWILFKVADDGSAATPIQVGDGNEILSDDPAEITAQIASMFALKQSGPEGIEGLRAKAIMTKNLQILKQYSVATRVAAAESEGAYPDDLAELREIAGLDETHTLSDPASGETADPIYFGGLSESDPGSVMVFAAPFTNPDGTRTVAFNDGSVQAIPDEDYQKNATQQKGG